MAKLKRFDVFCLMIILAGLLYAAEPTDSIIVPGKNWLQYKLPEHAGWSSEKLLEAKKYYKTIGSSAVMVIHEGRVLVSWGEFDRRFMCHSVRKSLLSALYGIFTGKGQIDLKKSLADIGIDDKPPLTEEEKKATIMDLLKARSGVYHPAAYETASMKKARPKRGSHKSGTTWYYNNWDFNALGTIFERTVNKSIGEAFSEWIAESIGMQDYTEEDVSYYWEKESLHPAYFFWITARDLARFGQLFLQKGRWGNEQILPEKWVEESTMAHSQMNDKGYGYMWWTYPEGAYAAAGYMGQRVLVIPKHRLVIVNRVFSGTPSFNCMPSQIFEELRGYIDHVSESEFQNIVELIIQALPDANK